MKDNLRYDIRELRTFRELAVGEQPWFIERDWDGNDVQIVDKNNKRLFSISGGIHLATYICMMNNRLQKLIDAAEKVNG